MNNKSVLCSVLVFSLFVAFVCGAFMSATLIVASNGEEIINTFKVDKTLSFKLISWMFFLCLAAFLLFTFAFKKKFSKKLKLDSPAFNITNYLGAAISSALAVYGIGTQAMAISNNDNTNVLLQPAFPKEGIYFPNILFIISLIGVCVYFAYSIISKKEKSGNIIAALSLFVPVSLIIKLICDFLYHNMNSDIKLYNFHLIAIGFLMLFAVNETRVYLRKSAPALYVFFGVAGAMSAIMYAVPSLVLHFMCIRKLGCSTAVIYCVADLLIAAFVYIRLFTLGVKDTNNAEIDSNPTVIFNEDNNK